MGRVAKPGLILVALLTIAGIDAAAAEPGYVAVLEIPAPEGPIIAHELLWQCTARRCVARASNDRPAIVCAALAKSAGPVARFTSMDGALDPERLAQCNAAGGKHRKRASR